MGQGLQGLQALLDEHSRLRVEATLLALIVAIVEDIEQWLSSPTSLDVEPMRYALAALSEGTPGDIWRVAPVRVGIVGCTHPLEALITEALRHAGMPPRPCR